MPKNVTIKLDEPLQTHAGFVHEITLRPPTVDDWFEIGDITSYITFPSGSVAPQTNREAIRQYVERLVLPPVTAIDIGNGGLRLVSQLTEAVNSFFTTARRAGEQSTGSSSNSGNTPGSASITSNE